MPSAPPRAPRPVRRPSGPAGVDRIASRRDGTPRFGGKSLVGAALTGLLAAAFLVLGAVELPRRQREAFWWVAHTLEVLGAAAQLEAGLASAASEGRGFLVDGTADSKDRFEAQALRVEADLASLRALTADNPAQQDALVRLAPLVAARIGALREVMQRVEAGDREGALRGARTQRGRALADQALSVVEGVRAQERDLLVRRGEDAQSAARRTLAGLVACGALAAASGLFATALVAGRGRERAHLDRLRRLNAGLEARVAARTADLAASEARLRESEASYRLLAEHAGDVVSRVGPDGKRRYVSPAVTRVLGLAPDELAGRSLSEVVHPGDRRAAETFTARMLAGAVEEEAVAFRMRRADGAEVWIEATARAVRDPATGAPDGYVAVWRDATERRRLEREREAHAAELEAANARLDRMARHLARARDKAEAASGAKSRFLASMSHELRTPLNGVLGYAQLLRLEGGLNAAQSERVEAMLGAGRHLLGMINRVLALSEIEAEHTELEVAQVGLEDLARACLDQVRPAAGAKGLALDLVVAPGAPGRVLADATRLRQVLLNLLGNAVKFTHRGSVELRLLPADGGGMRAEVADTGPGIPAGKRQRLFRDFERLGADDAAAEGAGLGLAISVRLARSMGGRVGHADNPGGGSVFWLELPGVAAAEAAHDGAPSATPDAAGAQVPPARPLRVLVVDDVAMNRDIARSFLRAAGHEAACAGGGAEAVEAAAATDHDAILMDVRMPEVDGLKATRRIRALTGERGRVPIIALTAQAFAEQVEECRRAGMDDHLAKPFTQDALLAALARAVAPPPPAPLPAPSEADGHATAERDAAGAPSPETSPAGAVDAPAATPPASAAPAIGPEPPVFDPGAFERTAAFLPPADVEAYLRTLAARGEALLAGLRGEGASGNKNLAGAAHAFAGSAGMFGFGRAADAARRFERACEDASPGRATLADGLAAAVEASLGVLRRRVPADAFAAASTPDGAFRDAPPAPHHRPRPLAV